MMRRGKLSRRNFAVSASGFAVFSVCDGMAKTKPALMRRKPRVWADQMTRPDDACDGVAINRAITKVHGLGGGIVLLSGRTYDIRVPVQLKSGVTLRGKGISSTRLRQVGTVEAWAPYIEVAVISTSHKDTFEDLHIEHLSLEGMHKAPIGSEGPIYAKSGIAIFNARRSSIRHCVVSDVGTGIGFFGQAGPGPHENLISDCVVRNASSWVEPGNPGTPRGITMATDYSTVRDCSVLASHTGYYVATEHGTYERCSASGWRDDGFYVNANYCRIENCRAIAADTRVGGVGSGFAVNPSRGNLFRNCLAMNCSNAGMRFRHAGAMAPGDNRVIDCTFIDCGYGFLDDMTGAGAYPSAVAQRNQFIGNTARLCQFCGYLFIRQSNGVFKSNQAISNNRGGITSQNIGGISFAEYCSYNVIEDNVCDDPQSTKTQKWGLYIYPSSITLASIENVGNRIIHKSTYGIDIM